MGCCLIILALALAQPAKPPSPAPPKPAPQSAPAPAPAASTTKTATPSTAAPAQTPEPAAQTPASPPPVETYTYRADGRRDPFQSLLTAGSGAMTSRKGEGLTGMTLSEISVRGVLQSRGSLVAMIQGPDNHTYIVHQGDKLLDGTIKTITPQGLVVVQEVNDPLSLVKQREVRKLLRSLEDAKE
jgi:Tfp pilus assembly protein PilP